MTHGSTSASTPAGDARTLGAGRFLEPAQGHLVWWCEGGDAQGLPVLMVHGGPGGRSRAEVLSWWDGLPVRWIAIDQRGCGQSLPEGGVEHNTLDALIDDMFATMYAAPGVGLAANQVGLPYRFFILNLTADREQPDRELVLINPEITKRHATIEDEEGCLSFPGIYAPVQRSRKIKVQAFDLAGNDVTIDADDLFSRAIQHELDHLDGVLFIDRLNAAARKGVDAKVKEVEAGFRQAQAEGAFPPDTEIARQLEDLARGVSSIA